MYYYCPFDEGLLIKEINKSSNSNLLGKAYTLLSKADFDGHKILDNLIEDGNALVLSALYSKENEDEQSFDNRHISFLQKAVEKRNGLAIYSLAVYYDTGQFFQEDSIKANLLFKEAAEMNIPDAMNIYGIMQYYGTGGASKNQESGLKMIQKSAQEGCKQAIDFLVSLS